MTAPPAPRRYRGDFVAWPGGFAFLGEGGGGAIDPHSHYAIQIALAVPAGLGVQFGRNGPWQRCAGAIFPSRAIHSIDVTGCEWSAVIFVEPETPEGKALAARLGGSLEILDPHDASLAMGLLDRAWRIDRDPAAVADALARFVRGVAHTELREAADPRVLAAMDYLRQRVDQPVSLEEVSRVANLSPSRFRHLFVQQTGMPLRTYLLWRRLLHVWTLMAGGETLSAAAHAAGFADSAHLSRTARTMFGVMPSALQMSGPLSTRLRDSNRHFG